MHKYNSDILYNDLPWAIIRLFVCIPVLFKYKVSIYNGEKKSKRTMPSLIFLYKLKFFLQKNNE